MSSRPSRCLVRGSVSECTPQQNLHLTISFFSSRHRRALSRYLIASRSSQHTYLHGRLDHIVADVVRPGETISSIELERRVGGKGANQAVAVARAGGSVALVGAVGEDGAWVVDQLRAYGVDVDGVMKAEVCQGDVHLLVLNAEAKL